jgi:ribosomal protein S18 acetylase RimI-like enzyme
MSECDIVPLGDVHRGWAGALIEARWGSALVVTRGRSHDAPYLPGFVAVRDGRPAGLATYNIEGGDCELVTLDSLAPGAGIGTALVRAVAGAAEAADCGRLWLITTNDNLAAVRFYQGLGFHIAAIHLDALAVSRRIKPEIPLAGIDGIPLTDEIELELDI